MRTPADFPRRMPRASRRLRVGVLVGVVVVILLLISLRSLARFWTDYLWFSEVHFTSVFRGVLVTKVLLGLSFILIFFVLVLVSLTVADRVAPAVLAPGQDDELVERYREVVRPHARAVRLVTSAIFAIFAGAGANAQWNNWDLLRYGVSFHRSDPQNHLDVGFYVFQLPFIKFLLGWFFEAIIIILVITLVAHYLNGAIRFQGQGQRVTAAVKTQVSVILGILALIKGVDYYFERLELVLSNRHLVQGATATSVHANAPADIILIAIAVIAAGLFLYNIRRKGWTLPIVAVGLWALVWILLGGVYPALYQALRVSPSELSRETPYIQRNIDATQRAYGITPSQVTVTQGYPGNKAINASQVTGTTPAAVANEQTLANVRLLDPKQVSNTFDKYQALRNYYQFNDLAVDRYNLAGASGDTVTQVITSMRELNENGVPSGFVNQKLQYTHGYGSVVVPASQQGVNGDGTPNFSLSGIPPSGVPALAGRGAQVYYGQGSSSAGFAVANSKQAELDYETSNGAQSSTHYGGTGGVPAGSIIRRAAFALRFGDFNMVLSGQVTSSSRVMYIRNIGDRVRKAAPFLRYDADPYAVVLNNQLYWIQDAYTTSANYPYSQTAKTDRVPAGSGLSSQFNYVRNSVKVVINAYTGSMYFFVVDNKDPVIQVYERAFSDLFTPVSKANTLIPGITAHFRYPEDLFRVQTNMYGRYHLNDAPDFYSQAQAWTISQDPGSGSLSNSNLGAALPAAAAGPGGIAAAVPQTPRLDPEYLIGHLPGQTQLTFLSLQPFVPVSQSDKSQNLTAFMTASGDPNDYGQLHLYETPPQNNVDGPALIVNAIRSNTAISSELTLLNQGGSQVILGQVEAIPVDQTLLYVQPVYVESNANLVPTLKDVVVVYNGTAYHSDNASLDGALCPITNGDGSQPFASYCNTSYANEQRTTVNTPGGGSIGGSTGSSSTTTSTTTPPSPASTVPPPASGQTVASLIAQAQQDFATANAALKAGNLAAYQSSVNAAEQAIAQAQALGGQSTPGTTTTLPVPATSSTTAGSTPPSSG